MTYHEPFVPKNYQEAIAPDNPWRDKWIEAMTSDIEGKLKNGVKGAWMLVFLYRAT